MYNDIGTPSVSIIVPCGEIGAYEKECVKRCLQLDYPNFELVMLPDKAPKKASNSMNVKIIPTGPVKPSVKRNIGIENARGELQALIDSDAYPDKNWLKNAMKYFKDSEAVAAVGGPSVTPENDNIMQRAGGLVLSSFFGGGKLTYRYLPGEPREDDDLPTCNLIVRRSVLERLGGFNADYWPGEDTHLCLQITKRLKMTMIYAPDVVVHHHRRPLYRQHLKQIWGYGLHRGYFVKRFPETSRRPMYFMPSMLVLGLVGGAVLSLLNPILKMLYVGALAVYLTACLIEGLKTRSIKMVFLVFTGIVLTHVAYGLAFLKGLLKRSLKD